MKNLSILFFMCLFATSVVQVNAQDSTSAKTAGIYFLYVKMADELTVEYKQTNNNRKILNSYSESAIFPDNLLDSVKTMAEVLLSEKLNADVKCIYKINKKGKAVTSVGANGELEGMPSNTFKSAAASEDKDYFIKLDVMMNAGGRAIILGNNKFSKIKPKVTAYITVFDKEKNVIWKNKVTKKDFEALRSVERTRGVITTRNSETLGPEDIYMIYEIILRELMVGE